MKSYSILVSLIIALLAGTAADAKYSGGSGEPNDPYQIATAENLNDIGNHLEDFDKHFILVNDVNLADYTGTQFSIIGRWIKWDDPNNKPFTGVFDGNDHKVWNFTWSSTDRNGIGLFGYVGPASLIKNLGMKNVDVNAVNGWWVGGLVGVNIQGTITNCYSSGGVSGGLFFVGGLVGDNYEGTISSCYSTGSVTGTGWGVGGLVGNNDGTITDCYSTGSVSGSYYSYYVGGLVGCNAFVITNCYSTGSVLGYMYIGGLVGYNNGRLGTITNCYSTGSVSGFGYAGGLVGDNYEGTISSCYSSGSVSGVSFVGGLVGFARSGKVDNCYSIGTVDCNDRFGGLIGDVNAAVVEDCFWDVNTSGEPNSAGGTPKTTAEMKSRSTFTEAEWDFVEVWDIGENQTYPFLLTDPAGDLDHDKKVNLIDLAILASHWLEGPP
jgi:hypothetical protein